MATRTLMTNSQKQAFHAMLGVLGYELTDKPKIISFFTDGKYEHCSDMDYIDAQTMLRKMRELLRTRQRASTPSDEYRQRLDKLRKGAIKSVFGYFEKQNKVVTMEYVKATICQATGHTNINNLTEGELTRVYNEFCRKQSIQSSKEKHDFRINLN